MKHYYGVVESREDPKQLGRLKVRIVGLHTEDKIQLPTSDLPWATVLTHDGSNSGLGTTPSFFVEGTWVLCCFFEASATELRPQSTITDFCDTWDLDGSGDIMPEATPSVGGCWEIDSNDDIMPEAV